jgi:hypothetical protein
MCSPFYGQSIRHVKWRRPLNSGECGKHHEPLPQDGLDEPFGPPPEEYLYRCPVCGEELLVNEAIIDVAIGAAKFRGEYTGGMPTLECPGCNSETMECIEQEP